MVWTDLHQASGRFTAAFSFKYPRSRDSLVTSSMHKALGSSLGTTRSRQGGSRLESQHSEVDCQKIGSSRSPLATVEV